MRLMLDDVKIHVTDSLLLSKNLLIMIAEVDFLFCSIAKAS